MFDLLLIGLGIVAILLASTRLWADRDTHEMWQEALDDKSGRKMRYLENWLKRGGPPPL